MARQTHGCWLRVSLGRGPQTFERNSRSGPHFAVFFFQGLVPLCSPICQSYFSLPKRRFHYPSWGCVHGTFDSSGKFLATFLEISSFTGVIGIFLQFLLLFVPLCSPICQSYLSLPFWPFWLLFGCFGQYFVSFCSPICQSYLSLPKRRCHYPSWGTLPRNELLCQLFGGHR